MIYTSIILGILLDESMKKQRRIYGIAQLRVVEPWMFPNFPIFSFYLSYGPLYRVPKL